MSWIDIIQNIAIVGLIIYVLILHMEGANAHGN